MWMLIWENKIIIKKYEKIFDIKNKIAYDTNIKKSYEVEE